MPCLCADRSLRMSTRVFGGSLYDMCDLYDTPHGKRREKETDESTVL